MKNLLRYWVEWIGCWLRSLLFLPMVAAGLGLIGLVFWHDGLVGLAASWIQTTSLELLPSLSVHVDIARFVVRIFFLMAGIGLLWGGMMTWLTARYQAPALRQAASLRRENKALGIRGPVHPGGREYLLKSQAELVDSLLRTIRRTTEADEPRVISMAAEWGQGKTFILRDLYRRLAIDNRVVVAWLDVWTHSTEPDLHLAMYEALLRSPSVGWPRKPGPTLLPVLALRYRHRVIGPAKIKGPVGEFALQPPTTVWQKDLERTVLRARRNRRAIVFILDEIDRCPPLMAQACMTLVRRSLGFRGTTVILPYVPSQARFKVFSPLVVGQTDLVSSMCAEIYARVESKDDIFETWAGSLQKVREEVLAKAAADGKAEPCADVLETRGKIDAILHTGLNEMFCRAGSDWRYRLTRRFEEKYLGQDRRSIAPLASADVGLMLRVFGQISGEVGHHLTSQAEMEALSKAVTTAVEEVHKGSATLPRPRLRELQGKMLDYLSSAHEYVDRAKAGEKVAVLASLVLVAYHAAVDVDDFEGV